MRWMTCRAIFAPPYLRGERGTVAATLYGEGFERAVRQGLTLVHFSAQRKHLLWVHWVVSVTKRLRLR